MGKREDQLKRLGGNMDEAFQRPSQTTAGQGGGPPAGPDPRFQGRTRMAGAFNVEVGRLVPDPNNPRGGVEQDHLAELTESVRQLGVLSPLRVRWSAADAKYKIVLGECRWRAAVAAGLAEVPVIEEEGEPTAGQILLEQLTENRLRRDPNPIRTAEGYARYVAEEKCTARELAGKLGLSEGKISKALALLRLPAEIRERVARRELSAAVAYEIGKLPTAEEQLAMANRAAAEGLTNTQVEAATRGDEPPAGITKRAYTRKPKEPEKEKPPQHPGDRYQFGEGETAGVMYVWVSGKPGPRLRLEGYRAAQVRLAEAVRALEAEVEMLDRGKAAEAA